MQNIKSRLKKINGQISGIIRMIDKKEDCEKIIVQFQAVKAAIESAFAENLSMDLGECLQKKDSKNIKKILKLISKK